MPFKKGETPPGAKPFQKGQSGNPTGRPKKQVALDAWRAENASAVQDVITADEIKDAWLRWFSRFRAGDPKSLWMVPYLFGQPPKAAEPEQSADERVTAIEIRRLDTTDAGGPS